jgi:choline dehydrogenase-like flavoprotein
MSAETVFDENFMIIDARSIPENEIIETDVCIVGAGTGGMVLAREFIGQAFQVLLLESGDLMFDQETQSLYCGENIGHPYYPLDTARARYFGGSSNYWHIDIGNGQLGVRLRPLDEIDFEQRDWLPYSGWPFDRAHLEPFYQRAQAIFRIEPYTYEVKDWEDPEKTPHLAFIGDRVQTIIYKFGSREPFMQDCRNEVIRRADNILSFLSANVVRIETNKTAQAVTRLRVACLQGNKFWVAAKFFILATGGIETPRLLLLSNATQSAGLGNQYDLVGRFFMEHLHFWSGVYVPSHPDIYNSAALYADIHRVKQVPIIGKLALTEEILRHEKLLNQNIQLIPRVLAPVELYPAVVSKGFTSFVRLRSALRRGNLSAEFGKHVVNMVAGVDDIARAAYRKVRRHVSQVFYNGRLQAFRLAHMTEQVPNPNSRVTLAPERDRLGQNRVRLDWQLSAVDILSVIRTQQIIDAELRRARLGRLYTQLRDETPPSDLHGGYHHMGTTRMHIDPKKGVVDANCRVHSLSNLFIAGPSVFPTGGYANPTLTIVALAMRLADHIKQLLAS